MVTVKKDSPRVWKLRVGTYRVICKIVKEEVWILGIM